MRSPITKIPSLQKIKRRKHKIKKQTPEINQTLHNNPLPNYPLKQQAKIKIKRPARARRYRLLPKDRSHSQTTSLSRTRTAVGRKLGLISVGSSASPLNSLCRNSTRHKRVTTRSGSKSNTTTTSCRCERNLNCTSVTNLDAVSRNVSSRYRSRRIASGERLPSSSIFCNHCLSRGSSHQRFTNSSANSVILICRQSDSSQNTDDGDHDHQFDQGKTLLHLSFHSLTLLEMDRSSDLGTTMQPACQL